MAEARRREVAGAGGHAAEAGGRRSGGGGGRPQTCRPCFFVKPSGMVRLHLLLVVLEERDILGLHNAVAGADSGCLAIQFAS